MYIGHMASQKNRKIGNTTLNSPLPRHKSALNDENYEDNFYHAWSPSVPSKPSFTTKSSNQLKKSNQKAKIIGEEKVQDYYISNIMKWNP